MIPHINPDLVLWSTFIANCICGLASAGVAFAAWKVYTHAISQDIRGELDRLRKDLKL